MYRCLEKKKKQERTICCYDITVRLWICIFGASMSNWFSLVFLLLLNIISPPHASTSSVWYAHKSRKKKKRCIWFVLFLLFYRVCFFCIVYILYWCIWSNSGVVILYLSETILLWKKEKQIKKNTLCMHDIRYLNKYFIQIDPFSVREMNFILIINSF